jgi:hypothetical protein
MADVRVTQAQFDAIPILAKQTAQIGLIVKKFTSSGWVRLTYVSEGAEGNWNITFDTLLIDNRDRNILLGSSVLDQLNVALRNEITGGTLTTANAAILLNYINTVLLLVNIGWLQESRVFCNGLATTAQFTTARKNFVLARIDDALNQL